MLLLDPRAVTEGSGAFFDLDKVFVTFAVDLGPLVPFRVEVGDFSASDISCSFSSSSSAPAVELRFPLDCCWRFFTPKKRVHYLQGNQSERAKDLTFRSFEGRVIRTYIWLRP